MNIIKLNATDSTNTYLIKLSKKEWIEDKTLVVAKTQFMGRGQMDTSWQSTPQQSLTFSLFKRFKNLSLKDHFYIAFAVSIGIKKTMENYLVPDISIKWPNDIMSLSKKMSGILIENQIRNNKVINSVIGVGLNVNEEYFKTLPQATSMFLTTGIKNNLDKVLKSVSKIIFTELDRIEKGDTKFLKNKYEEFLFRKDRVTVFEDIEGNRFNGIIKGVSEIGELQIEKKDYVLQKYKLKEIKMLF